ncbi:MAG: long-chain fatty acid--CoA ligase, partial [Alphaproteobacteria bacterium]
LIARAGDAPLPAILSVGAGPMPAGELAEAAAWASARGAKLYHTYGLTEAGPRVATLAPEDIPRRAGSVGRPRSARADFAWGEMDPETSSG